MPKTNTPPTAEQFGASLDDLADALGECLDMARAIDSTGVEGPDMHAAVARFEAMIGGLRHE